jgi:hypothetical protein
MAHDLLLGRQAESRRIFMGMRESLLRVALVLPLLILTAPVGCGESGSVDTSLLTGEPCKPPCWQGLVPGLSTEEEVDEFVRTSELVDQTTLFRRDITRHTGEVVGVAVHWWSRADTAGVPRQFGNSLRIKGGVVQYMMIWLDCEVTLEELLSRYGEPHKWSTSWVAPDIPDVDVVLYYPNHGFTASLTLPADDVWLRPESNLDLVRYYPVVPVEDFLQLGPELGYFYAYEEESLREWQGYGIVWF